MTTKKTKATDRVRDKVVILAPSKDVDGDGHVVGEVDEHGRLANVNMEALRASCKTFADFLRSRRSDGETCFFDPVSAITLLTLLEHKHAEPPRPRGLRARVRAALGALLA